jgi:DNA polymerase-3 subunit gamma/tau
LQSTGPARSLYRRHRPRTFADVVGQDSVVRTLRNAVELGRVHHAYLFVGSRGTGKTSMAKILAACLDCEQGPTTEPCGVCASCRAIAEATSLDVIEMDAASNNSVEDIRELREQVAFAPVSGRHKVYILDEAHMLSPAAWNAFLKTLEEPPPSTVFVLATTEAQKVPATVVDRCHRFDFQRPSADQIAAVLGRVAGEEQIEIGPEAVAAIARSATGSFRDALGTLEQLLTYSGPRIELADVLAVLGVLDAELLERIVDAVDQGDAAGVLVELSRCLERGRDAAGVASDIEARARELLVVQTLGGVPAELSLTAESDTRLADQSARVARTTVVRLLELIGTAREATRAGADSRTQLELALVRAANPEVDGSAGALLARVERLEARLSQPRAPADGDRASARGAPLDASSPAPTANAAPKRVVEAGEGDQVPREPEAKRAAAGAPTPASASDIPPAQTATQSDPATPKADPATATADPATDTEGPATDTADPATDTEGPAGSGGQTDQLSSLEQLWPKALDAIRAQNAMLWALVSEAKPVEVDGEDVTLAFASSASFLKRKAEDPAHFATVTSALKEITGRPVRLSYELREDVRHEPRSASEEDLFARLMAEFDAEEVPVAEASE